MIIGLLALAALLVLVAGRATAIRGREIADTRRENFMVCLSIWSFEGLDLSLGERSLDYGAVGGRERRDL